MITSLFNKVSRKFCDIIVYISNPKTDVDSARFVDDILSACTGESALKRFLKLLDQHFRVRHLGGPTNFLGMAGNLILPRVRILHSYEYSVNLH